MQRRIIDLIDNIHVTEQEELGNDIEKVHSMLKEWQWDDYEPVCYDVVIEQKLQQ